MWRHRREAPCFPPPHPSAPLLLFPPPLPPSWLRCRCLFRGLAWSERCLVKSTRAPYHLCKCTVPWMFHANCHVLFKQLWGYPQKVARKLLSVLPVSFPLKTPQWAVQHWDSGTTHSHPASSSHFICICLKAAFYLNDQMHVVYLSSAYWPCMPCRKCFHNVSNRMTYTFLNIPCYCSLSIYNLSDC